MTEKKNSKNEANFIIFKPFHLNLNCLRKYNQIFVKNPTLKFSVVFDSSQNKELANNDYFKQEFILIENLKNATSEQDALKTLSRMWKEKKCCDLIIVSNGREHLAHKVVLAFYSEKYK